MLLQISWSIWGFVAVETIVETDTSQLKCGVRQHHEFDVVVYMDTNLVIFVLHTVVQIYWKHLNSDP